MGNVVSANGVLEVRDVSKRFGGVQAVSQVSFSIGSGQICGLIGPNGAGKTTLFNLVTGVYAPDTGTIRIAGHRADGLPAHRIARLGVARTFQNLQLFDALTVRENVMVGLAQAAPPSLALSLLAWQRRRQEAHDRAVAEEHLARVGLAGAGDRVARELSFGEQRLVEVARALATRPRLLLLDEPASGLSKADVARLVRLLRELRTDQLSIFLIEHDVSTVMELADAIVVLNYGKKLAEGPPSAIRGNPAVVEAYLGTGLEDVGVPKRDPVPAGRPLLRVENLVTSRGELEVLHGVSLDVAEGQVAGVIGANGAGKSTLLGTLAGLLPRRSGEVWLQGERLGAEPAERTVRRGISLVPERRQVFSGLSVRQNLLLGAYRHRARGAREAVAEDMARVFRLFPRLRQLEHVRAGALSGGEQQMLAIGRGLMARPTLLMLDEPSLGLAPRLVAEIFQVLSRLRDTGTSILIVEQNARAVFEIADRIAVLERGQVLITGSPHDLIGDVRVVEAYLGGRVAARAGS